MLVLDREQIKKKDDQPKGRKLGNYSHDIKYRFKSCLLTDMHAASV